MVSADDRSLIVSIQTPLQDKPCERPLHHPAARQDPEAFRLVAASDDLKPDLAMTFRSAHPPHERPDVAAVVPAELDPPEGPLQAREQEPSSAVVTRFGGVDMAEQDKPESVHGYLAPAPVDLLARVLAAGPLVAGAPDVLSVDQPGGLSIRPSQDRPNPIPEQFADPQPDPFPLEPREEAVAVAPMGHPQRDHAPLAAAAQEREGSVQEAAPTV